MLAAIALLLVLSGRRGRAAAARGAASYGAAAVVANVAIKPLVRRPRPAEAGEGRIGPVTSSFPSGHAATDLAFAVGVAQEIPVLFLPLAALTAVAHWSLVRTRGHHAGDVFAGGALGIAVALVVAKLWPRRPEEGPERPEGPEEGPEEGVVQVEPGVHRNQPGGTAV